MRPIDQRSVDFITVDPVYHYGDMPSGLCSAPLAIASRLGEILCDDCSRSEIRQVCTARKISSFAILIIFACAGIYLTLQAHSPSCSSNGASFGIGNNCTNSTYF